MSIDKKELIAKIAQRVQKEPDAVEEILDATLVEIYESLKQGESVSNKNPHPSGWGSKRTQPAIALARKLRQTQTNR